VDARPGRAEPAGERDVSTPKLEVVQLADLVA
jgi:hypothetical protein